MKKIRLTMQDFIIWEKFMKVIVSLQKVINLIPSLSVPDSGSLV
ncbi:hypothetical protein DSUL_100096 [Desulfovibrionales bacterium]